MYRAFQKDIIIIAHDVHVGGPFASEGAPKWRKINLCNILWFCRHLAKLLLYFPKICPETILPLDLSLPHKIAPKKTLHEKSISDTEPFFQNCSTLPTPSEFTDFLVQHISLASQSLFPLLVNFNMKRDKNRVAQFTQKLISRNQISTVGSVFIFGRPTDSNFYLLNISNTFSYFSLSFLNT